MWEQAVDHLEPFWTWKPDEKEFWGNLRFWELFGFIEPPVSTPQNLISASEWQKLDDFFSSSEQILSLKLSNPKFPEQDTEFKVKKLFDAQSRPLGLLGQIAPKQGLSPETLQKLHFLESAQSLSKIGIWELDVETASTNFSEQVYQIYEIEPDQKLDFRSALSFHSPSQQKLIEETIQNTVKFAKSFELVLEYQNSKGNRIYTKILGYPQIQKGVVKKIIGIYQDLTDQKNQENLLSRIINETDEVVWSLSWPELKPIFITDSVEKQFGVSPKKWLKDSRSWFEFINKKDKSKFEALFEPFDGKTTKETEIRVVLPNQLKKWLHIKVILSDQGSVFERLDGVCRDITKIKKNTNKLLQAKKLAESTSKITLTGGWQFNLQSKKIKWSAVIRQIFGVGDDFEPNFYSFADFAANPRHKETIQLLLENAIQTGEPFNSEIEIISAKNEKKWLRIIAYSKNSNHKVKKIIGSLQDISEKKKAEIELQNKNNELNLTQTKLKSILDSSPDSNILLSPEQKILNFNAVASQAIKYSFGKEPELGEDFRLYTHAQFHDIFNDNFQEALSGKIVSQEYLVDVAGSSNWFLFQFFPVFDPSQRVIAVTLSVTDIDEKKKALQKLEEKKQELGEIILELEQAYLRISESETALRSLIESQTTYWVRIDTEANYTFVNEQFKKNFASTFGTSDFLGKSSLEFVEEEKKEEIKSAIAKIASNPKEIIQLTLPTQTNGKEFYTLWEFTGITDKQGNLSEIQCIGLDISELKIAERSLQESEMYYRLLVKSIPDALFILSTDGTYLGYKAQIEGLNLRSEDYIGKNIRDIMPETMLESYYKATEKALNEKVVAEFSYDLEISGQHRFYNARLVALGDDKILVVAKDTTESVLNLKRIESLLKHKENQNQILINFTHVVSHNLRSHTANMTGLLYLFEKEQPEVYNQNEYLEMLKISAYKLNETIVYLNQILDIENTQKENWKNIDLAQAIQSVLQSLHFLILESQIEIQTEIEAGLNLNTIPAYFESIVLNFTTNAIKYRSIERKSYFKIKSYTNKYGIELIFEDNGLGIDLNRHGSKLFGMFKTFHQNSDSKGVGLFITKNQIEALGGTVEVQSQVNVGSTFKVILPK
jgi:PAS domain S-box-containing protein